MTDMEKKFLHERLRKPKNEIESVYRALIETRKDAIKEVGIPCHSFPWSIMQRNFDRFKCHPAHYEAFQRAGGINDPCFKMLAMIGHWLVEEPVTPYVFTKEFFRILMKTKLTGFTWDLLPDNFLGVLRFPNPIIDGDGDPIHEVVVAIQPMEKAVLARGDRYKGKDGRGSKVFWCWFQYSDKGGSLGYFDQIIPDDGKIKIVDSWNRISYQSESFLSVPETIADVDLENSSPHLFQVLKALAYINSGDPDLREFRNKIRFQSKESQTPVKDHKAYSLVDFQVVGYNWMKEREHNVDSWGVEPFMRRQRVGVGRSGWKYVMVKEHTRSWREKTGMRDGMSGSESQSESPIL